MTFDLQHVTSHDPLLTADGTVQVMLINDVHSLCNNYDFVLLVFFTCHVSRFINLFPPLHMAPLPGLTQCPEQLRYTFPSYHIIHVP